MKKIATLVLAVFSLSCQSRTQGEPTTYSMNPQPQKKGDTTMDTISKQTAIFAGGCFWCTEAFFTDLKGVEKVTSGYIGGTTANPTYREVCSGYTGHAEAIKIDYNPQEIGYEELLEVFFATHDPTTLNRQGADVGTQYRSEVFYTTPEQKDIAEKYITFLGDEKVFDKKIVTKVTAATTFYPAEDYHQDYYSNNQDAPYCSVVISPKLDKLRKNFKDKLKETAN
ncbi:peptide-methionine (S)-S-oxide reductase [Flavobacterium akiainvivens]|nr:peptide-methionine (S)-S-oxide reductase [Flavobacterium akiainvivens]